MSANAFISNEQLAGLVAAVVASGTRVIAPVTADDGTATYSPINSLAEATLNGALPNPSLKAHFLPPTETLMSWRQHGSDIEIGSPPDSFAPQLVLGARPCDAAAMDIVDSVMNWDYKDELWNARRDATTVISLACPGIDDSCFCTAVGLGPDSSRGADVLLVAVDDGYLAEFATERGAAFLADNAQFFSAAADTAVAQADESRAAARSAVEANLNVDTKRIEQWVGDHFDDEFWLTLGPRCNGCGACAFVCPTCHCFDIADEQSGVGTGVRRRSWDTCQSNVFTVHASGHNPRGDQNARYRQRINHKFYIYPSKFGDVLCTGCGRCIRACPAGQDLVEILQTIDGKAANEQEGVA
jgi:ferredoxin